MLPEAINNRIRKTVFSVISLQNNLVVFLVADCQEEKVFRIQGSASSS